MNQVSRRALLGALAAGALGRAQGQPLGKLKITKFVLHKCTLRWRDLLFLEIQTDAGLTGIGEGSLHTRVEMVEQGIRWLEPHFIGQDPAGVEDHWDRMYYRLTRWRNGPVINTALAAVDIALWDLEGKRLGVPVWRLLGAAPEPKMRVYFTHWNRVVKDQTPTGFGEAALAVKQRGWTAIKFDCVMGKTDAQTIALTTERLAAIRKAAGEDLDIALELGERFTPRQAIRFAEAMHPFHPLFLEEATLREAPEAMTEVAAKSPVPLATGEGLVSRYEFRRLLDCKGAAIIQPDVLHCGGITELRRIADFAQPYGVEVAPHMACGPVGHVASLNAVAGCRNFLIEEWEAEDDDLFRELTAGSYPTQKAGYVTLPDRPGLGIQLNFAEFEKRFPFRSGARSMPGLR